MHHTCNLLSFLPYYYFCSSRRERRLLSKNTHSLAHSLAHVCFLSCLDRAPLPLTFARGNVGNDGNVLGRDVLAKATPPSDLKRSLLSSSLSVQRARSFVRSYPRRSGGNTTTDKSECGPSFLPSFFPFFLLPSLPESVSPCGTLFLSPSVATYASRL